MFSGGGDTNSDDELDFSATNSSLLGLSAVFGPEHQMTGSGQLAHQPTTHPTRRSQFFNKEEKEEKNKEIVGFEPMTNVHPGVKMATAVNAFKFENNGFKSLGRLGLAIIGNKESNFYQLLLYQGKQQPVGLANITPDLELSLQKDNFASFMDEKKNQWTMGFESQDVLVNFLKQFLLCKTVFRNVGALECDLCPGEGRAVQLGDSVEVNVSSWVVEHQSLGSMLNTVQGQRIKLGGGGGWEGRLAGMRKGGRRFIVLNEPRGELQAHDLLVTRTKAAQSDTKVPDGQLHNKQPAREEHDRDQQHHMTNGHHREEMGKSGLTPELPELEEVPQMGSRRASELSIRQENLARRQSFLSAAGSCSATHHHPHVCRQDNFGISRQEWNLMHSETRMANTELRINMARISDKMDDLLRASGASVGNPLANGGSVSHMEEQQQQQERYMAIMRDLDIIRKQTATISTSLLPRPSQDMLDIQAEKLRQLEEVLKEKEEQLHLLSTTPVEQKRSDMEGYREEAYTEIRKVINSTGKFLLTQFSKEETYSGEEVQYRIADTLQTIAERLAQKYGQQQQQAQSEWNSQLASRLC